MRIDGGRDRRNPAAWSFDTSSWEKEWALKKLIQVIAFDDADALADLRKHFHMLNDQRERCPECNRRGCEPWNHDYALNPSRAVCTVCYEKGCTPKEHV